MWELYDRLIDEIPNDLIVKDALAGLHWTLVKAKNTGMVMTFSQGGRSSTLPGKIVGMKLKKLAAYAKSWNYSEAAWGLAAINAYYNTEENVIKLKGNLATNKNRNAFVEYEEEIMGKKVAVIGHFPNIEELGTKCQLSILERMPSPGDFPDPACEYILGEQDYVFITGTSLTNKTLPRLLQLSQKAKVIMVGPSVPLAPIMFDYGVDVLASTVIVKEDSLWQVVKEGACLEVFESGGQMVRVGKPNYKEVSSCL
jgi:uncharacterized protein (DUF4213/DUF364 family)